MTNIKHNITKIFLISIFAILFQTFACMNVFAAQDYSSLLDKWNYTQAYHCARNTSGVMVSPLKAEGQGSKNVADTAVNKVGAEKMPSYNLAGSTSDRNCRDAIKKILGSDASTTWHSPGSAESLLKNKLKYEASSTGNGTSGWFTVVAHRVSKITDMYGHEHTGPEVDPSSAKVVVSPDSSGTTQYKVESFWDGVFSEIKLDIDNKDRKFKVYIKASLLALGCSVTSPSSSYETSLTNNMHDLFDTLENNLPGKNTPWVVTCRGQVNGTDTYWFTRGEIVDSSEVSEYTWSKGKSMDMIKAISGDTYSSTSSMYLNKTEFYKLYTYYLDKMIPADNANRMTCSPSDTTDLTKVKLVEGGELKDCYANLYGVDLNSTVTTQDTSGADSPKITEITIQALIDFLNSLQQSDLDMDALEGIDAQDDGGTSGADRPPDCFTNAGALGWIVCPTIELGSNVVERVYTGLIEQYLKIDAVLFDTETAGGATVRNVWSIFQGFANLAFVIVFLFVIFSQLTGVGIDNYGIKKILPKLIIAAVLINMSYIICQLAVDLSNIIGTALGGMFKSMAADIDEQVASLSVNLNPSQASSVSGKFPTGVLVIVGIASILGIGAFLAAGPAIFFPALLSVLSLAFGILFLFILLALRQAVAVILVVVSPMAFAAYILPNTKKIFDKWFEAFKGMLIAYPICAALVYGGDFVSKILLISEGSSDITSLGIILSAAAVAVAPIFFIPSVIRKGMNGIAGLGDKIGKMQSNLTGKAKDGGRERLNNSRLADYQNRRRDRISSMANQRRLEKNGKKARRVLDRYDGRDPSKMNSRQRARYQQAVRNEAAYSKNQAELSSGFISSLGNDALVERMQQGLAKGDLEQFESAFDELGARDQGELMTAIADMSTQSSWRGMNNRQLAAVAAKCRGNKGNAFIQTFGKMLGTEQAGNVSSFGALLQDHGNRSGIMSKVAEQGGAYLQQMDKDQLALLNSGGAIAGSNLDWGYVAAHSFSSQDMAEAASAAQGINAQHMAEMMVTRGANGVTTDAAAFTPELLSATKNSAVVATAAAVSQIAAANGNRAEQTAAAVRSQLISDGSDGRNAGALSQDAHNIVVNISGSGVINPNANLGGTAITAAVRGQFSDQIAAINKNQALASATSQGIANAAGITVGPTQVTLVPRNPNNPNNP